MASGNSKVNVRRKGRNGAAGAHEDRRSQKELFAFVPPNGGNSIAPILQRSALVLCEISPDQVGQSR